MDNKTKGLVLVLCGLIFLLLGVTMPLATVFKGILLGSSLILNVSGTVLLMNYIKTTKESSR
ncbi:hypothetical protein FZC78_02005 [Rossellomorea vietnamensis]|uniref:Uncharacterized protein n=1 Tax=Rossellomorea vietnamensis TaxID=218284 RepID=A0A5D4P278_9BACI|nr:hypothetical protein [Rossellomorea vietnamensis]TYS19826.1 hypothetical protein FZC78_02005 [Rossellomorea vietnamensis]